MVKRTSFALALSVFILLSSLNCEKTSCSPGTPLSKPLTALGILQADLPKNFEVCFSPEEPCDVKLAKFVQSAQKSLDIAVFDINLDKVVHEVLVASRKIPVRVLVDKRQAKGPHSLVALLVKAGASVRFGRQRGVMHNKFTIVDGKMIETGSFNYTNHAATSNSENQIYLSEPSVVERYKKRFEVIWAKGKVATLGALTKAKRDN